jgi:hypothetical protein
MLAESLMLLAIYDRVVNGVDGDRIRITALSYGCRSGLLGFMAEIIP